MSGPANSGNVVQISFEQQNGTKGTLLPLFLGLEFAEKFVISLGEKAAGMTIVQIENFDAVEALLIDLKKTGVTHVNFNAVISSPNPIGIDEVIDSVKKRLRL